jgi:dienelactone hydrolase
VDIAAQVKAPVLGLYGGKDPGIPLDSLAKMESVLAEGGKAAKESRFVVYPEARMPSMPTTAPATSSRPPTTAGSRPRPGSGNTA